MLCDHKPGARSFVDEQQYANALIQPTGAKMSTESTAVARTGLLHGSIPSA